MRIRLAQKDLLHASDVVAKIVSRSQGPMPALNNVLVDANAGTVRFEGTDMETHVAVNVPGTIETPGSTTVDAVRLNQIVKVLPGGADITLEAKDGKALLTCDKNEFKLLTLPAEDFKEWAKQPALTRFRLDQKALRDVLKATAFAIATSKEARRVLFGVYVELKDNTLRLTATDGKKLARVSRAINEVEGNGTRALILPSKPTNELSSLLGDQGTVDIEMGESQFAFTFGDVTLRTQAIDGKYPDCDAVIPKEFAGEVVFDRDRFLAAIRRAAIVATDPNRSVVLKFDGNECEFMATAYDIGSFSGKLPVTYSGEPIRVAFNCEYMTESLNCYSHPEIRMHLKNNSAPVIFKSDKEPERLALLMPIKLAAVPMAGVGEEPEE